MAYERIYASRADFMTLEEAFTRGFPQSKRQGMRDPIDMLTDKDREYLQGRMLSMYSLICKLDDVLQHELSDGYARDLHIYASLHNFVECLRDVLEESERQEDNNGK